MPNYKRNRIILGSIVGAGVIASGVIALVAGGGSDKEPDRTPIVPNQLVTTSMPTTSTSNLSVDELLRQLDEYKDPEGTQGSSLTLSQYNSITTGVSEERFLNIVSAACTKSVEGIGGSVYQCHGWGRTGANALFQFQAGKLVSKSQSGLTD